MKTSDVIARRLLENVGRLGLLHAVAQSGSFSRAARALDLTQPALSHAMKSLETRLGVTLFIRRSKGVELTDAGRQLAEVAGHLRATMQVAANQLVEGSGGTRTFQVGTHEAIAVHVWPSVLKELTARDAGFRLSLVSGRIDDLVERLLRRGLDFLVTVRPTRHKDLDIRQMFAGTFHFFEAADAPASRAGCHVDQLRDRPILTDIGAHCRQGLTVTEALYENGLPPGGPFEVASFDAAMNLAASGLGVAFVPEGSAVRSVKEKRLRRLEVKGLRRQKLFDYAMCLTRRKDSSFTIDLEELSGLMRRPW